MRTAARFAEWAGDSGPCDIRAYGPSGRRLRACLVGRIHNARELADDLAAGGHSLRTGTEPEILALCYRQWGDACVKRLRGTYAFFIFDEASGDLLLARDRIGTRPLYYMETVDFLAFGSHFAALRAVVDVPLDIDPEAIDTYLALRVVPAPFSVYRSVSKLPAAHALTYRNARTSVLRYWDLDFRREGRADLQTMTDRFSALLKDAVCRLDEEEDRGVLLSAGPDSAIVLALMSECATRPVRTFSFAFKGGFDELAGARRTAEYFRADHTEFDVEPRIADFLPAFVDRYEEPNANGSALFWCKVKQLTGDRIGALATGEGADEAFGGRDRHLAIGLADRLHGFPVPSTMAAAARLSTKIAGIGLAERFFAGAARAPLERHLYWLTLFAPEERRFLYREAFARQIEADRLRQVVEGVLPIRAHRLDQAFALDLQLWIPEVVHGTLCAEGTEILTPFLDHRIVELAATLPPSLKAWGRTTKRFLRSIYAAQLPRWFNHPRRRGGVSIPLAPLLHGELRPWIEDCLLSPMALIDAHLDGSAVRRLVRNFQSGNVGSSARIWALLMLELWLRRERDQGIAARQDRR
jgi:asparagine synthase (glutamine-hydrolysing)